MVQRIVLLLGGPEVVCDTYQLHVTLGGVGGEVLKCPVSSMSATCAVRSVVQCSVAL